MTFRDRLHAGETLAATWIKTPHPHVVEVLSLSPLDALVLDAEHAPFGRAELDACLLAALAGGKPVLVRPPSADPAHVLNALDCGATGVVIPHIRSAAETAAAVRSCRYGPGGRGYAGSTRAAGYTTAGMARHREQGQNVIAIAQIEDREALETIAEIAAVDGLDALFIGRADLTVSLDAKDPDAPVVVEAVEAICAAARDAGRPLGMFVSRLDDIAYWRTRGASLFILQSDHEFLLAGGRALKERIAAA